MTSSGNTCSDLLGEGAEEEEVPVLYSPFHWKRTGRSCPTSEAVCDVCDICLQAGVGDGDRVVGAGLVGVQIQTDGSLHVKQGVWSRVPDADVAVSNETISALGGIGTKPYFLDCVILHLKYERISTSRVGYCST